MFFEGKKIHCSLVLLYGKFSLPSSKQSLILPLKVIQWLLNGYLSETYSFQDLVFIETFFTQEAAIITTWVILIWFLAICIPCTSGIVKGRDCDVTLAGVTKMEKTGFLLFRQYILSERASEEEQSTENRFSMRHVWVRLWDFKNNSVRRPVP